MNSPYINHFVSADTIVPTPSNPQSWNRYSYVRNNPVLYNDPTGHREDLGNVGNQRSVNCRDNPQYCNNGKPKSSAELNAMRNPKRSEKSTAKSTQMSTNITLGISLGNTSGVQDNYGDYENNTNVPSFPGGNTQPNPCVGAAAAAACLGSLFVSIVPPASGPINPANNFFLSFNLTYVPGGDTTISELQWSNTYQGDAVFNYLKINDTVVYGENSYIPHDGSSNPIDGTYTSNRGIDIRGMVSTVISTPNGSGSWPYPLTYTVPDLP